MAKLWQKNYQMDALLEDFTVGLDWQLDQELVRSDCAGSIAHARGLHRVGILQDGELAALSIELRRIAADSSQGRFEIRQSDEDCHTAIENRLVERLGDAGKRIHTGRSRNDQVLTASRILTKARLLEIRRSLLDLVDTVISFAASHSLVPMPGRTHMQTAMPSSVGLWASALAEQLLDDATLLQTAFALVDRSPLGSAASYGVPLALDRSFTAGQMGFRTAFHNVLAANNSRGKVEAVVLDSLDQTGLTLSKYAQDLILFSLPEFAYFKLPDELCSGSSIMPQKKNPDGLELIRSRSAMLGGWASQVKGLIRSLPTGYNRDFQDSKEPLIRGLRTALGMIRIMDLTFSRLQVNQDKLKKAFTADIYATDEALRLVASGMPFRDAYLLVGLNLASLGDRDPVESIVARNSPGNTGNLDLEGLAGGALALGQALKADRRTFDLAMADLLGDKIEI